MSSPSQPRAEGTERDEAEEERAEEDAAMAAIEAGPQSPDDAEEAARRQDAEATPQPGARVEGQRTDPSGDEREPEGSE